MRNVLSAVLVAAMMSVTTGAMAQTTPPSAKDLKGPPNASGYGKDRGIDKSSPMVGTAGTKMKGDETAPSAKDMKGPPNANGYNK